MNINRWMKRVAAATAVAITISSAAGFLPGRAQVLAAGGRLTLGDDVLSVSVNAANGRFAARTTGGDPANAGDGDKPLVYEQEVPDTSYTSFRIDGEEVIYGHIYGPEATPFGYFLEAPQLVGQQIVSTWRYKDVDIRQTVDLVQQGESLPVGNAKLSYRVDNKSGRSVKLGTRILLDVTAGDNDGPLLMAPGELSPVRGEREFGANDVPLYWQAMDNVDHPSVIAYGTLYGFGEKKPSRVVFGHWNGLSAGKWLYAPNPWTDYAAADNLYGVVDSAVAIYWDEAAIAGGDSASFSTLVGMGEMEQRQTVLDNMTVSVAAPQKVAAETNGASTFELSAIIANDLVSSADQGDVRVEISYPTGVQLTGGDPNIAYIPSLSKGERMSLRWRFAATGADTVNVYAFKVRVTVGDPQSPGVKRREESAHVVVLPNFRQPPDIQFTAVAPNKMYVKEAFRKVVIRGSSLNFLKDDPDKWRVYVQDARGTRTTVEPRYVTVDSNNQLSVMLPELPLGTYGIGIEHELSKGMYRPDAITITNDIAVMTRGYGTLLITKKDVLKTRPDIGGQYTHTSNRIYYGKGDNVPTVPAGEQEVLRIQGNIQDMNDGTYSVVPHPSQAVTIGNVLKLTVSAYDADMPGEIVVKPTTVEYSDGYVYDTATQAVIAGNDQSRIYLKQLTNMPQSPLIWKSAFTFNVNDMKIRHPNVFGFSDDVNAIVGPYVLGIKQMSVVYDPDEKKYAAEFKGSLDILSILKTLYKYFGASDNAVLGKLLYAEIAVDKFRVYEDGKIKFALEAGIGLPQMKIGPFVGGDVRPGQTGGVEGRLRIDTIQNLYSIYTKLSLPNLETVPTGSGGSFARNSRIQGKFGVFTVPTPDGMIVFPDEFMAEYADNVGFISIPNVPLTINQLGGEIKGLHTLRDSIAKGIYPDFSGSFWFGITDTVTPVLLGRRAFSASNVKLSIGSKEASLSGTGNIYVVPIADLTGKIMFYPVTGALVGGRISLLDVIVGQASVELSYNNESSQFYFGGYVRGYVQIPTFSPILPGVKLADASAALNTNFVQAYAKALGTIPVGVRYTWSTQQVQFINPDSKTFALSEPGAEGSTRLAVGTNLTPIPVKTMSGVVTALDATTLQSFVSAGGEALLVQAKYERGSDIGLKLTDPDGAEISLVETGNGQNVIHSEYTDPDTGSVQDYIAVSVPAERNKPGTWTIRSSVPAEFDAFGAAPLPEIKTIAASQNGEQAGIELALSPAAVNGRTKADLYLESVETSQPILTRVLADVPLTGNAASLQAALPDSIGSGSYKIVAVLKQFDASGGLLQNSFRESAPFAVVNPKVPAAPGRVTATAIGSGGVKVEWDAAAGNDIAGYYVFTVDEQGKPADGSNWMFVPYADGTTRYAADIRGWPTGATYRIVVQAVSQEPGGAVDDPYADYPQADAAYIDDPLSTGQYVASWSRIEGIADYVIQLEDEAGRTYTIPYSSELYNHDESADDDYYDTKLYGLPPGKTFDIVVKGVVEPDYRAGGVTAVDNGSGQKRIGWDKSDLAGVRSYTIYGKPQGEGGGEPVLFEYPVPPSGQPVRYADIEVDGFADGTAYDIEVYANVATERPEQYFGLWSTAVEMTLDAPTPPVFDMNVQPVDSAGGKEVRVERDDEGMPYFRTNTTNVTLQFASDTAVRTEVRVNPSMYDPGAEPMVMAGAEWSAGVALKEGANEIEIAASDEDGDTDVKTYRIAVKTNAPLLAVDDVAFAEGNAELTGQTDVGATVTVNGYPAEVETDGRFAYRFPLPDRQVFDLQIVAADAYGGKNVYTQQTVNPAVLEIDKIVIGMQREMKSGDKQPLRLYAYDRDGAAVEIPNDAVEWTVLSGQTYAELTGGELKGLRQGQAVVEASFRANEQYAWTDYGVFDIDQISTVPMTDLEAVTADLAALAIRYSEGDDPTSVMKTVYLPVEGANGSIIEWSSSRPTAVDAATGQVTRPSYGEGDTAATLTATVVKGDVRQTKAFQLNVKQLEQTNGGGHPGGNGSGGGDGGDGGDGPGGNAGGGDGGYGGGSGTGDGGGNSAPTQSPTDAGWRIDPAAGGTVSGDGIAIQFPAGSFPGAFRVSIGVMSEDEVKRLPAGERRVSQIYEITKSAAGIFLKPVTLTLPFDRDRLDSAVDSVAVYWYNEVTGEWVPLDGATIDWTKGTVSGQTIHFTKFAVLTPPGKAPSGSGEPLPTFADIAGHWAEASIRAMAGRGGIDGYPDGTFRPDREVTRAEFVQLLVRTVGIAGKGGAGRTFADTANHWAHDAIAAAAANGIVDGYDERTFGPDDPITRQQMAAMLVRALKLPAARSAASFVDSGDISAWALTAVTAAAERGLIDGYEDGTFRPFARATRAETVAVLTRASQK